MKEQSLMNKISWCCTLMIMSLFFAGGFLVVSGMKLANVLFAGVSFNQKLNVINHESNSFFTAEGEVTLPLIPDQANVNLGVQVNAASIKQAKQQADQLMNNLTEKLLAMNIKKEQLKTTHYSLSPNYDYSGSTPRITSYFVDSGLEVTLSDFDTLNQAIDLAGKIGINHIGQIRFSASQAKLEELKKQARAQAIEQAKQNAQSMATLTGVKLGEIINIFEHVDNDVRDECRFKEKMMSFALNAEEVQDAGADIQAGREEYHYKVSITYSLKDN